MLSTDASTILRRQSGRLYLLELLYDEAEGRAAWGTDLYTFDAQNVVCGLDTDALLAAAAYLHEAGYVRWRQEDSGDWIDLTIEGLKVIEDALLDPGAVGPLGSLSEVRRVFVSTPENAIPANAPTAGALYRHFRGGQYRVLLIGRWEPEVEWSVIYRSLDDGSVWVRPLSVWLEEAEPGVPRFRREVG